MDWHDWQAWQVMAALISSLGIGSILTKLVESIKDSREGKHAVEQSAWVQRDREAQIRRRLEEHVHDVRMTAIEHGVPPEALPPWPRYPERP